MSRLPDFLTPPPVGSALAAEVDDLFAFALLLTVFSSLLIAGLIVYLGLKYRRRAGNVPRGGGSTSAALEVTWSVIPLGLMLVLFYRGAQVFFALERPPADADEYFVVARQWMWKLQHPEGVREINELHVPLGRAIKLTMTSEDVVHSFYVPAFRLKNDVIPGRYTTTWFRASRPGTYHLFCAEYCGTEHSGMIGRVVVMEPVDYEAWLAGGHPDQAAAPTGEGLFVTHGCPTCHRPDSAARAPILNGLAGRTVHLASGAEVSADDDYLRQAILRPAVEVVAGYPPVMPAFEGRLSEEEVLLLIGYIHSLKGEQAGGQK